MDSAIAFSGASPFFQRGRMDGRFRAFISTYSTQGRRKFSKDNLNPLLRMAGIGIRLPVDKEKKNLPIHGTRALRFGKKLSVQAISSATPSISEDSTEDDPFRTFLEVKDFTSAVLEKNPSQIEAKYMVNGKLYTLREKEMLKTSFWQKIIESLNNTRKSLLKTDEGTTKEDLPKASIDKEEQPVHYQKPVYLSDLLREYKGELYVPEEAFKESVSDLDSFRRSMRTLPIMTFNEFLNAAKAGQITLLTSRAVLGSRKYDYHNFIVNLKNVSGEEPLHRTKWVMHLTADEAAIALKEYTGPQVEIETQSTPYIVIPPSYPNPVAASISGKVVLELAVASGVVTAAAYSIGGAIAAAAFMGISAVTVSLAYIVAPLLIPMLWPFKIMTLKILEGVGFLLLGGFTSSSIGRGGLPGLISRFYEVLTSGTLYRNARILAVMVFVIGAMALIAKFTLTRRPKDFTKWDLWQAIEFGQSKPQARVEGSTGVLFEDIAGIDDVVEELQELVTYLKNPERFNQMGTKPPHGVLLEGPPGCGKTLLAKAIAGEAGVPFYQMAGSEFVEVLVGVGAARVRDLFKRAKVNRPSVVFIDEIDALGAMRQGGDDEELGEYNAGSQERETTLNQLLIELDGFDTGKGVVFLGATNRMDMLDPALLRPGRFDRKITVKPPRAKGRLEILKVHAKRVNLSPEVDLWTVAKNLPGWSGAELAQLLQEGAMMAVRNGHSQIIQRDLDLAVDRITIGPKRMGVGSGLAVHRRMATLEVGFALTSHLLRRLEGAKLEYCERVSIVPRGETLSQTIYERLDDEAYFFERRPQLLHRMQVFLGGRAAEEVMYGRDTSTWSIPSLRDASWMARKLITIWNLEGPMTVRGEEPPWQHTPRFSGPPLDFEGWLYDDYGFTEHTLNYEMDNDVSKHSEALINRMYAKVLRMLKQHQAALAKAIYVILDKEEMFGYELDRILDEYPAGTPLQFVEDEADPAALPQDSGRRIQLEGSGSSSVGDHIDSLSEVEASR